MLVNTPSFFFDAMSKSFLPGLFKTFMDLVAGFLVFSGLTCLTCAEGYNKVIIMYMEIIKSSPLYD